MTLTMEEWDALTTREGISGAIEDRNEGSNLTIALGLYDVGGGTVESLTEDWNLTPEESATMLAEVKAAWKAGRWRDRREQRVERRQP